MKPLAVSVGDPAGIGPELIARTWAARRAGPVTQVTWFVCAPADAFRETLFAAGLGDIPVAPITRPDNAHSAFATALPCLDTGAGLGTPVRIGSADPANATFVIESIRAATELALTGDASGVVTAPIAKAPLLAAGFAHPGHTEFLGALCAAHTSHPVRPVMMLTAPELTVSLVTVHIGLAAVSGALSSDRIMAVARVTADALKSRLGIANPRIAIAGLNPHAGEAGAFGNEERDIIAPAVDALRAEGLQVTGPLPPDTMFHAEARKGYDAAVCMYHDQGLIPLKTLNFWGGVNVTLGLPIVRTSPDHGCAFDIAGRGIASTQSFEAALTLAGRMASSA